MAKLIVVAIRDRAINAFNRPFFVPSLGLAVRSFTDEVNRGESDNPMFRHPDDFELYQLGFYDEDWGTFECGLEGGVPQPVVSGGAVKVRVGKAA